MKSRCSPPDEEGTAGAARLAVLSHGMWVRRYGGDAGVLGRPVILNGIPTEIIGVMPASFAFPDARIDAWIPQQYGLPIASTF